MVAFTKGSVALVVPSGSSAPVVVGTPSLPQVFVLTLTGYATTIVVRGAPLITPTGAWRQQQQQSVTLAPDGYAAAAAEGSVPVVAPAGYAPATAKSSVPVLAPRGYSFGH